MLIGVAIEFAQGLTPYRFFEWADAAANAIGVCLGWALAALLMRVAPANWFPRQS
jgi:glycopeptide antibiotics resistance protein